MPKRLTSVRLSNLTDEQVSEMAEAFNMTNSEIFTIAVDRLYRDLLRHGEVMEDAMYLVRKVQRLESTPAGEWPQWSGRDLEAVDALTK